MGKWKLKLSLLYLSKASTVFGVIRWNYMEICRILSQFEIIEIGQV
jgi:hypothetical protein